MPRGGSRGRSSSPPPRSSFAATKPAQQPRQQAPVQQTQKSGGLLSGIGSTIMTGMAFGAGSEVAHQAVRGVMGGDSHQTQEHQGQPQQQTQQYQTNPCQNEISNFSQCIQRNDDLSYCQNFSDMLKTCKQQNGLQ